MVIHTQLQKRFPLKFLLDLLVMASDTKRKLKILEKILDERMGRRFISRSEADSIKSQYILLTSNGYTCDFYERKVTNSCSWKNNILLLFKDLSQITYELSLTGMLVISKLPDFILKKFSFRYRKVKKNEVRKQEFALSIANEKKRKGIKDKGPFGHLVPNWYHSCAFHFWAGGCHILLLSYHIRALRT